MNYTPRMRIVFFVLLLANLAYFAWARWVDVPQSAPQNEELASLPKLELAEELPPSQRPQPKPLEKLTPALPNGT